MTDVKAMLAKKGWKTYTVGSVLAFLGTLFAFLDGVRWDVILSPESAAVAGAGVVFGRALVALFRAMGEKAQ